MKQILLLFPFCILLSCCSDKNSPTENGEQKPKREYTKSIDRISSNDYEKNLIYKAESFYPPRDSVLAHVQPWFYNSVPDTNLWYYNSFDGIFIPYAVTTDGINYYSGLIDMMTTRGEDNFIIKASFEYNAQILFYDSFTFQGNDPFSGEPLPTVSYEKVYVVTMLLKWEHYCGPECGLWISHKRIVVFDEDGNLLDVFYDGVIPVMVS